jgi:hypothetical protein
MHILRLFVLSVLLVALSACRVTSSPPPTAVQISDFPTEIAPEAGISMDPFEVDLTDMEVFKPGLIEDMHPILVEHADKTIYRMDWTISPPYGLDHFTGPGATGRRNDDPLHES